MIYMHHTDDSLSQSEQDQSSTGESKGNRLKGVGLHWTDLKFIPIWAADRLLCVLKL